MDHPTNPKEREANQFAAALLMPRDEFAKKWVELNGDKPTLSNIFGASGVAIGYRAQNTLNEPNLVL